jgi:hypothetical protein
MATLYKHLPLIASLTELADELDKGENMDIGWVKYQGYLIRRAIIEVAGSVHETK